MIIRILLIRIIFVLISKFLNMTLGKIIEVNLLRLNKNYDCICILQGSNYKKHS